MKQEVWLRTNRRVILGAMLLPGFFAGLGALLAWTREGLLRGVGLLLVVVGGALMLMLAVQSAKPRLALAGDRLRFWLRSGPPLEVPIDVVECFFLGRSDAALPSGRGPTGMVSVVARLAEAATEYRERPVKPALGRWADGYVVIGGTWCEPLSLAVVNRLNQKLSEAQRRPKGSASAGR